MKNLPALLGAALICAAAAATAAEHTIHTWQKLQLTDQFWAEGAHFADFNKDGKVDIVSGPYWYEGPDFKTRHEIYPATKSFKVKQADGTEKTIPGYEGGLGVNNTYSDNFITYTYDINGDGWPDVIVLGYPGKESWWFENPQGKDGHWKRHVAVEVTDNESPMFVDLTGDGKPEILCTTGGFIGYYTPDWKNPTAKWTFHKISAKGGWQRFTHGIGYGDINGDGRADIILLEGWWEQPASLEGDPEWKFHPAKFGAGGAQMYAYDVNGDGLPDVITSLVAHGYGLAWFEQLKERDAKGEIQFRQHNITGSKPEETKYGLKFSQIHAIDLVDMDGDGLKDIVTGKRFWAHGPKGDLEPAAPAVVYWFKLVRNADKTVDWVPYLIDDNSGVGTQVAAGDVNGDGLPDVIVGNKKGTFVHLHGKKTVSAEEWEKAQPKPVK